MRNRFGEQLERLHVEMIQMGALCEDAISAAAQALMKGDEDLARAAGEAEREIDQKEREVENLCLKLLLQQQPVASDLRVVSSALKMISDMERIGDQAADIADLAPYIVENNSQSKVHIGDMALATVKMVTDSVEAFVKTDAGLAEQVIAADDEVDGLFNQIKEELMQLIYSREIDAKASMDLLMAAKYFERIGDHAVNIAEWVEFSISGQHRKL